MHYDFIIIGGGIIGLSTAWQLQMRRPHCRILLLEKETRLACHQSGHNSGVIHAGLYYHPHSLKARFCREGAAAMRTFCQNHAVAWQQTGKLLVATSPRDYQRMSALFKRCRLNGVPVTWLDEAELHRQEPNLSGRGALYIADTAMVDYASVTRKMASRFLETGGECLTGTAVEAIQETGAGVVVSTSQGMFKGEKLIVCAGLMADRLVRMQGLNPDFQIIPFRGEYYRLPATRNDMIRHQIYPIPDPDLPFLGVHLTRTIDGGITVGPNAVLGLDREGYGKFSINARDVCQMLTFGGFWQLLRRHMRHGLLELKNSLSKRAYLKLVQQYCPQLALEDLLPHPAGIRAQAVLHDGTLLHDFLFRETAHTLHVCNAPSPAATSSIPIGAYLCDKITGASVGAGRQLSA